MSQTKPTNLVFKNYDKYFCHNQGDDRIHLYNLNLHSLWFKCLGSGVYVGIGFACAFVVITMILLLGVIIYRKRWWFRYQYFLAHRVYQNYNKIATFDTPFEYDLFVSYNRSDYQWVDEVLQPKLEDELGLRLCLHHRDFRLGKVITEQIIESVQSSKKHSSFYPKASWPVHGATLRSRWPRAASSLLEKMLSYWHSSSLCLIVWYPKL